MCRTRRGVTRLACGCSAGACNLNARSACFDVPTGTCEFGAAWVTDGAFDPHAYAECSGKGVCDRTTGECVCFDGYTGAACKRSECAANIL